MGRLLIGAAAGAVLLLAGTACAYELAVSLVVRAVSSDATNSRLEGGVGKLRYDRTDDVLRLVYLHLGHRVVLTHPLRVTEDPPAYADNAVHPLHLDNTHA